MYQQVQVLRYNDARTHLRKKWSLFYSSQNLLELWARGWSLHRSSTVWIKLRYFNFKVCVLTGSQGFPRYQKNRFSSQNTLEADDEIRHNMLQQYMDFIFRFIMHLCKENSGWGIDIYLLRAGETWKKALLGGMTADGLAYSKQFNLNCARSALIDGLTITGKVTAARYRSYFI